MFSDEHSFRFMGHVPEEEGGEAVETPALDRLAAQGTVFSDAYCQMPLCTPSRICMLTGREVRRCGAWSNNSVLRPELPTLPGTLAEAGYETCLVGKMHLGGNQQFAGFQHRPYGDLTGRTGHQWEPLDPAKDGRSMRARTETAIGTTEIPESLLQDVVVTQESLAFMREQRSRTPEKPWFVCASFSRPHFPLTAPARYTGKYGPDTITGPRVPASGDAYDHPMSVGMRKGFMADAISHEEMMRARAAYFATVAYFDEVIGDFLVRCQADGLLDNTIIVYSTDHGEMAGEHGVWWKNGWYEACTRVPFIISTPEQRTGEQSASACRTPVGLGDLFPTLCAIAGVETPDGLDGVDLSPSVLTGADAPDRPIFCDALTPRWGEGTEFRMVRQQHYKYVRFRNAAPLFFDLESDPGEQHNLVERGAEGEAAEMLKALEEIAAESIDFEEAERERVERDGSLHRDYPLDLPPTTGNLYLMPSGKLINADDPLYHPTVIAEDASEALGDFPS